MEKEKDDKDANDLVDGIQQVEKVEKERGQDENEDDASKIKDAVVIESDHEIMIDDDAEKQIMANYVCFCSFFNCFTGFKKQQSHE